jgi:uncharacterized protein with HEPN domain
MKGQLSDDIRLKHILDSIKNIKSFCKGIDENTFLKTKLIQSAVERQLEIIGEAASMISEELKEEHNYIEWQKIKAFRNVIAHQYFGLSKILVWTVICVELPKLKKDIQKILKTVI